MRRVLQWVGRALTGAGAIMVLFVVYLLWGTGLLQAAEQRELKSEVRETLATAEAAAPAPEAVTVTTLPPAPNPALGEPIGIFSIPAIGVEQAIVEGAGRDELQKGPGHYPHSPFPGQAGNVSVAGHRTTYGAPFNRIDELEPGDEIGVETAWGSFRYVVTEQKIVAPDDVSVISPTDDNRITLTTCNPKYSARERLIVVAHLEGEPIDSAPATPAPVPTEIATERVRAAPAPAGGLDGGAETGLGASRVSTLGWTLALVAVGVGWWLVVRWRKRLVTALTGVVPFLVVLFFFFGEVERLLPANY